MNNFKPDTSLYGKPTIVRNLDGEVIARGILQRIDGPFDFALVSEFNEVHGETRWSITSTDNFRVEDDTVYLDGAF